MIYEQNMATIATPAHGPQINRRFVTANYRIMVRWAGQVDCLAVVDMLGAWLKKPALRSGFDGFALLLRRICSIVFGKVWLQAKKDSNWRNG